MAAAAEAAAADSEEDAEAVIAPESSEDEYNKEEGEEQDEEEGTQDPAAKPLAPIVLKAPTAKQKPGKVIPYLCLAASCLDDVHPLSIFASCCTAAGSTGHAARLPCT